MKLWNFTSHWITLIFFSKYVLSQQQYFRLRPKDVKIHEGGEVVMECEVSTPHGQVQWTKDGFALGFISIIPAFPRYSMIGDKKNGVHNLKIQNATLDDDGEFQCQVGPLSYSKPIRANAKLTVISPPSAIEIVGRSPNSKIETKENEEVDLECVVKNSKPAARIVWYRGSNEIKTDKNNDTIVTVDTPGDKRGRRYNVISKIKLKPTSEDDNAEYTCEARHEALQPDMPLKTTVQLSVLYPPGQPYIKGYTEGETIRRGQTVELICRSRGGNPPAQLIWYKNGEQVRMAYRTDGRLSENIYTFTADSTDNKAKYRCEGSNIMSPAPLKAETTLTVLFAPAEVTISGSTEARAGDKVALTCTTDNSNPPADVKWMVAGRQVRNATSRTVTSPKGGWVTSSNITVVVGPNRRSLVVICHGLNMQLTENVVSTHTINVLYPPGQPIISGYQDGSTVAAGTVQKISCISSGGNPLASLTWYKNDKKISSVSKISERSVSAEVTIITNVTDNEARYKCESSNSATETPLFETVTLHVLFPPDHVQIRKEPVELKPGQVATLTCESSSSNPPAKLSWWKEGIPVTGTTNSSRPGLYGGTVSAIELKVNITPEINGYVYTCQATNEALQRSVHDAFTLEVLYKPKFEKVPAKPEVGIEGEPMLLILEAKGNPPNLAFTWSKDGSPLSKQGSRVSTEGSVLNITKLTRNDTGVYSCEASNKEGATVVHFNISVNYGVKIINIPESVVVSGKEDAQLFCTAEGSPLTRENIKWKDELMKDLKLKLTDTFQNNTSYLVIQAPTKEQAGPINCVVDNGIGNKTWKTTYLLVKYKPEIDSTPSKLKSASNTGDTGRLVCRASGVPAPKFTWSRDASNIPVNTSSKYYNELHKINLTVFESILLVNNVQSSDYGKYNCVARNELGFTTAIVSLDVTSAPDPPLSLTVVNVTHDTVMLSWLPGFDGGMKTSYRIRFKPILSNSVSEGYRYLDVVGENSTQCLVKGLDLATDYVFSIMGFNKLGSSNYLPDNVKVKTSNLLLPEELLDKGDVPRIVIIAVSITGAILLLFNIALVVCFVFRKKNKRVPKGPSEQSSNKSATIEMYAPSSYNETLTGETLSSVSEKSENYSNGENNEEYPEDGRKIAASTYLIDQIDYPFQYPAAYEMQHQLKNNGVVADPEAAMSVRNNTLPHNPMSKGNYIGNTHVPPQTIDGAYYNLQPDSRYVPYPATIDYSHTLPSGNGSLRRQRGPVPPDVTVLHNPPPSHNGPVLSATLMPQPALSTFSPGYPPNLENEGHLV